MVLKSESVSRASNFGSSFLSIIASGAIPRKGRPEEVAATAVFLCSAGAGFITGCDIRVDGGELIGMGL